LTLVATSIERWVCLRPYIVSCTVVLV
jgi:hypothetical protein